MESIGARLKKIRLEKGLTLEEVHKKTKIHLNILKAMEEDTLINLSPIYIKGFLKIYCKYLKVDYKDFIPKFKEEQSSARHISKTSTEKPMSFLKSASIKLSSFRPKIKLKVIFNIILIAIFIMILFYLGKAFSLKRSVLSKKNRLTAMLPSTTESKEQINKLQKTAVPISNLLKLVIRAKEDSWVSVKTDGRVVFQSVLKKGRFEVWQAKEKIEFSLGNAGTVVLEVNGKIISNLGKRGQVIKNISLTKEGLNIPR